MTATPGASKRLGVAGNDRDGQVNAPKGTTKSRALTTASQSSFTTTPGTTIAKSGKFYPDGAGLDVRGNQVQLITLANNSGADTWVIDVYIDGTFVGETAALDDDAAAATVQSELRSVIGGTDLTTVTVDAAGPGAVYTVTFNPDGFYSRHYPKLVVVGTGMTGTVTHPRASQVQRPHLGVSRYDGDGVGPGHALTGPTIGTITVTGGTDEVQTLNFPAFSAGGGSFELAFRRAKSGQIAASAQVATVQAAIDAMFTQLDDKLSNVSGVDSPVVTKRGTNEVQTLVLTSFDDGDTIKLTHAGTESGAVTAAAGAGVTLADFQTKADALFAITIPGYVAGACVVTQTVLKGTYVFTFSGQTVAAQDISAITATSGTGSATGVVTETTKGVYDGFVFTFSRGYFNGKPVRGGFRLVDSTITDGEADISVTTPGVLGSISAAYTELTTYGDSVLAVAVNDDTGKEYSNGTGGAAVLDASTPVVISNIPAGNYTLVMRTYDTESQRLGPASTKTFVQT